MAEIHFAQTKGKGKIAQNMQAHITETKHNKEEDFNRNFESKRNDVPRKTKTNVVHYQSEDEPDLAIEEIIGYSNSVENIHNNFAGEPVFEPPHKPQVATQNTKKEELFGFLESDASESKVFHREDVRFGNAEHSDAESLKSENSESKERRNKISKREKLLPKAHLSNIKHGGFEEVDQGNLGKDLDVEDDSLQDTSKGRILSSFDSDKSEKEDESMKKKIKSRIPTSKPKGVSAVSDEDEEVKYDEESDEEVKYDEESDEEVKYDEESDEDELSVSDNQSQIVKDSMVKWTDPAISDENLDPRAAKARIEKKVALRMRKPTKKPKKADILDKNDDDGDINVKFAKLSDEERDSSIVKTKIREEASQGKKQPEAYSPVKWPSDERITTTNKRIISDNSVGSRGRRSSDAGFFSKSNQDKKISIEALDLVKGSKIISTREAKESVHGRSNEELLQQRLPFSSPTKHKKAKHKGRIEPEPDFEAKESEPAKEVFSPKQVRHGISGFSNMAASPLIAPQGDFTQMIGYSNPNQMIYSQYQYPVGNYVPPQTWNSQGNPQWVPVIAPHQNYVYPFYNPAISVIPQSQGPIVQQHLPFVQQAQQAQQALQAQLVLQHQPASIELHAPLPAESDKDKARIDSQEFNKEKDPNPMSPRLPPHYPIMKSFKKADFNINNEQEEGLPGDIGLKEVILETTTASMISTSSYSPPLGDTQSSFPPSVLVKDSLEELSQPAPPAALHDAVVSSIRQNILVSSQIPNSVSQDSETQRLAALYLLDLLDFEENPRLNKITQMTARLLGKSCCILSLVDSDKVFRKSVYPLNTAISREELRYVSFCSWVVQDDTGRGVTVLDASTDPRCSHIKPKAGLEFYAGVPVYLGYSLTDSNISGKYKIGALSIQGPPETSLSVIDMNLLHEMSTWASGEIDTLCQQKILDDRDNLLLARDKLGEIAINRLSDKTVDSRSLEKCLGSVRNALKAHCVLLLSLTVDSNNTGFKSTLQAYSVDPASSKTYNLPLGEEMFHELCHLTLKKESGDSALLIENLKTGPVTKEVDLTLSKKITKCLSEILWSASGPTAIIAAFFEGGYRTITKEELSFLKATVPNISKIYEAVELKESFQQAALITKNVASALKKYAVPFGKEQGMAPCAVIVEIQMNGFKGYQTISSANNLISGLSDYSPEWAQNTPATSPSQPKGQAVGQSLVQKQLGVRDSQNSELQKQVLLPSEAFQIITDFSVIIDGLAEKCSLKRPKKLGQQYHIFANYGPDTGSFYNAANFSHELLFLLDTYNQKEKRNLKAKIGIHTDFISAEISSDNNVLRDQIISIINGAYLLANRADPILTSELFYHQTKNYCAYEANLIPLVTRGQGAFSTYRLIGTSQSPEHHDPSLSLKENGVNNGNSLITDHIATPGYERSHVKIESPKVAPKSPRKMRCSIM